MSLKQDSPDVVIASTLARSIERVVINWCDGKCAPIRQFRDGREGLYGDGPRASLQPHRGDVAVREL